MSKEINFKFQEELYKVNVERKGNNLILEKDGKIYTVSLIEKETKKRTVKSSPTPSAVKTPQSASMPVQDPHSSSASAHIDGIESAPITGTIKELKIAIGDNVNHGDLLLIMEAMKMDIEVFSNGSGMVEEVNVKPGDNVKENQQLLRLN